MHWSLGRLVESAVGDIQKPLAERDRLLIHSALGSGGSEKWVGSRGSLWIYALAEGDDLERIAGLVNFVMFRPDLYGAVPARNFLR